MRKKMLKVTASSLLLPALFTGSVLAQENTLAEKEPNVFYGLQMEELEYRYSDTDKELGVWNGDAFIGTDELKFRWITEGEYVLEERAFETLENQFVLQKPLWDFFDIKAGVRFDTPEGPNRTYGLIGLAGLAPYWFEVDTNFYVSEKGDTSFDVDIEYELLLTNYLILTPSADIDVAFSSDEEAGVGSGLSSTELGARLSYDLIDRAFSPYVGVVYERLYGKTEDFANEHGEDADGWFLTVGAKLLF
ncbi:copper resistance protein B [Hydrocarboniclastica marina]|uniref:Copper resistance protein B n=1 Tax=Hydrocarboniclastica marina TaxID=2259620 RepID=A0A4P7XMA7_9ALTE|nr:copper resistance protein B [Hydrocarboniclastica marina]QCF28063.1 copper resistance protein B [Hydrocarboniclastica marina]